MVVNCIHGAGRTAAETTEEIRIKFTPDVITVEAVSWLDGNKGPLTLTDGWTNMTVAGGTGVLLRITRQQLQPQQTDEMEKRRRAEIEEIAKMMGKTPEEAEKMMREQQERMAKLAPMIRDDYTAIVHVVDPEGQPVSGVPWEVKLLGYSLEGTSVARGVLPSSGIVEVQDLAGGDIALKVPGASFLPDYSFMVGDEQIGIIQMYLPREGGGEVLPLPNGAKSREFTFHVAPSPGQMAPDIMLEDLASSRILRLSDLRGQVILLDFWAVGCGACQKPLGEYHEMAIRRAAEWSGRVTIVGANLDRSRGDAGTHVRLMEWTGGAPVLLHTWCPIDAKNFNSGEETKDRAAYAIRALPTSYLIDPSGKIVWREIGYGSKDVEQEIVNLLEHKK